MKTEEDNSPRNKKEKNAIERFRKEICKKHKQIDKDSERNWFDLSYGFFLALKFNKNDTERLSCYCRYDKNYWS